MERNRPTAQQLLAATGSAWLEFSFPPFPVWRLFYEPEPGNNTNNPSTHALYVLPIACNASGSAVPETKYVSAKFILIDTSRSYLKAGVSNFSLRDQTIMINLMEAIKNLFAFINSILESCFRSSGNGVKKNKSVRRRVQRSRTSGKGIYYQFDRLSAPRKHSLYLTDLD